MLDARRRFEDAELDVEAEGDVAELLLLDSRDLTRKVTRIVARGMAVCWAAVLLVGCEDATPTAPTNPTFKQDAQERQQFTSPQVPGDEPKLMVHLPGNPARVAVQSTWRGAYAAVGPVHSLARIKDEIPSEQGGVRYLGHPSAATWEALVRHEGRLWMVLPAPEGTSVSLTLAFADDGSRRVARFELPDPGAAKWVIADIPDARGSISGKIQDDAGRAVANVPVCIRSSTASSRLLHEESSGISRLAPADLFVQVRSATDGSFVFEDLPMGDWVPSDIPLLFDARGWGTLAQTNVVEAGTRHWAGKAVPFRRLALTPERDRVAIEKAVVMRPANINFHVRVNPGEGVLPEDVRVAIEEATTLDRTATFYRFTPTSESGRIAFMLPPGHYFVSARVPGEAVEIGRVVEVPGKNVTVVMDVAALHDRAPLTVEVEAMEQASVTLQWKGRSFEVPLDRGAALLLPPGALPADFTLYPPLGPCRELVKTFTWNGGPFRAHFEEVAAAEHPILVFAKPDISRVELPEFDSDDKLEVRVLLEAAGATVLQTIDASKERTVRLNVAQQLRDTFKRNWESITRARGNE